MSDDEWLILGAAAFVAYLWYKRRPHPVAVTAPPLADLGGDPSVAGMDHAMAAVGSSGACSCS